MKKLAFLLIMALGTLTASAQKTPHAIGAHFGGSTIDLEYQYHFSKRNFLDLTAGVFNLSDGFALQGVYNWNIKQWPGWTPRFATWKTVGRLWCWRRLLRPRRLRGCILRSGRHIRVWVYAERCAFDPWRGLSPHGSHQLWSW